MAHPLNPGCWELQIRNSATSAWKRISRDNDKPMMDIRFKYCSEEHVKPGGSCRLFALDTATTDAIFTLPGEPGPEKIESEIV